MKKTIFLLLLAVFTAGCTAGVSSVPSVTQLASDIESTKTPTVLQVTEAPPTIVPSPSPPPPSPTPELPTLDKWALWTEGTQLRGANLYQRRVFVELDGEEFLGDAPLGPPYTQADFDALAASGANYVNISAPGLFTVFPPYEPDEDVQTTLDSLVEMAAAADLFVVLSARTGPGRSEFSILREGVGEWFGEEYLIETVWEDETARAAWAEMWQYTAERYRDNPIVVGYDLMVEPNADEILESWEPDEFYAEYADTGYDWTAWYPSLIDAIREVDPETPILVSGMGYGALYWLPSVPVVDDARVVYTFHQYEPYAYTHQSEDEIENTYPGFFDADWDEEPEKVDRQWLVDYFYDIDLFRTQNDRPVAANECGVIRWEPGAAEFMRDQWNLFEEYGINYAAWMWYPSWQPMIEDDHDFNFRLGAEINNRTDTDNDLWNVYKEFWQKNNLRPSDFLAPTP
jgi:heme-degrading monooxygenase HmoA